MATPNNSGHDNAPPVNGPRRLQLSLLRQRLLALVIAGVGSAAASIISYASAIYAAANPEPIRQLAIGEELDTGLWHVVFADARLADRPPTGFKPSQPKTFVTVAFRITNQSASSAYVSRNLLQTDPQMPPPTLYLARDNWIASPINPGMPEDLIAVWELEDGQPAPEQLRIHVGSQIYKKRDNLYGASSWLDRDPVAVISLPLSQPLSKPLSMPVSQEPAKQ
ncbi:hypothetical protein ACJKIH_21625 [Brucella pseudogrignonensis]|uniref:hypothetical protein n=1 Tax=Brucella pseudogrignonensis TaxID=419475 RepID=UPI0038B53C66